MSATCPRCGGSGQEVDYIHQQDQYGNVTVIPVHKTCTFCNGSGRVS